MATTDYPLTINHSRRDVDERVSSGIRSGLGQAKKQRLFEQTKVGFALVCVEAGNDASWGIIACGFGRNSRRLVSTYNQGSPCGKLVSFARKRRKICLNTRINNFLPASGLTLWKKLVRGTNFFIRVCFRDQLKFSYFNSAGRKLF